MSTQEIHSVEILDNDTLSLVEMTSYARVEQTVVVEMVAAGLFEPVGYQSSATIEQWRFAARDLRKLRAAQRLMHDLDINLAGAAALLDLCDERDALLSRVAMLQRMLNGV